MRSPRPCSPALWKALSPLCGVLLALPPSGCGRESPTALKSMDVYGRRGSLAAGAAPSGAFFPLVVGNRWHAVADVRHRLEPAGGGPPLEESTLLEDITRVLIGKETLDGHSYTVEEETTVETGDAVEPGTIVNWFRYRQDGTGLYQADVGPNVPPVLDANRGPVAHATGNAAAPRGTRPFPAALAARVPASELGAYRGAWDRLQARAAAARALGGTLGAAGAPPGGPLAGEITRLRTLPYARTGPA